MKTLYLMALLILVYFGCTQKKTTIHRPQATVEAHLKLAEELAQMVQTDQVAAYIPQGKYKQLSQEQWKAFQDSVFTTHQKRLEEIFKQYGYPGFDLVGKEGSKHFWLMVQHSDHHPDFQKQVLEKMKTQIEKQNADPSNYGFLVDRVNLNTGKAQIYGTQVSYNTHICQGYPKELADSANVNQRRKTIGLPPLEEYLNEITQMHFEMNKESYLKQGITEPKLYKMDHLSR